LSVDKWKKPRDSLTSGIVGLVCGYLLPILWTKSPAGGLFKTFGLILVFIVAPIQAIIVWLDTTDNPFIVKQGNKIADQIIDKLDKYEEQKKQRETDEQAG
jgi:hypothetical protein